MMKKRLFLASTILLFVATFTACKKQDASTEPIRSKMIGKWQVNKIDVTTYAETGTPTTVTTNYSSGDYMNFQDNETDDVELGLGSNRYVGSFGSNVNKTFYLDFPNKDLECTATTLTDNQFQFTGTIVGSNPKVTETYYLSR